MNCPVCNRKHTAALSICPSCGAMTNDSVREELIGKISARLNPLKVETVEKIEIKEFIELKAAPMPSQMLSNPVIMNESNSAAEILKSATANIEAKPTNPTLVEFHNKNAAVPEWRLQLQNAVRQRQGQPAVAATATIEEPAAAPRAKLVTSGANALKSQVVEAPKQQADKHPDLARALDRIEKSRRKFLVDEEQSVPAAIAAPKANKNYPFYIAAKTSESDLKPAEINPPIGTFAKPKLAASLKAEKLDTNKLPMLDAEIAESFAVPPAVSGTVETSVETVSEKRINSIETEEIAENDDCPTFAMRFNAGLFDLIIGSFASLCLLSPFMLMGGEWLSGAGFFAFAATASLVMFVYLTIAVGFYGRTFGMRLFSLELIDINGEEYPTFHQAAVSSSVYLLSLTFGGLGFLTVFFNEEKRAAHDLVSNTIIVKE